jgi:hypothetical protein
VTSDPFCIDLNSNVTYGNNLMNTSFGELYHPSGSSGSYDGLNQLTAFSRGVLSQSGSMLDTISSPSHSQSYITQHQYVWSPVYVNALIE